nr:vacuolar protein sorting-associated protein 13A-like isoform X2 [Ipomoea batatas]
MRRRYVQLYAESLQQLSHVDNSKLRSIEKDLDPKVILLWRFLAHAKVESVKSKEAAEQRHLRNRSWFSFTWRASSEDVSAGETSEESKSVEDRLTKEEWQAINKLLSYQPDEDVTLQHGKEMQNTINYLINVSIGRAAATIINVDQTEILCGRFENLNVSTKLKHRTIHCDVSLKFYGLSAPEGSLAQSVCSERKVNALEASFVHSPSGENVDWRLSARISPSHVTVFMESYDRFLDFVKRSNAISPAVALETATVLQNKIEKMTRRAQEQFQMVLEEQSR